MISEDDMARLPRWKIREPNHREFAEFKKNFLLNQARTSKEKELLRYIGELQSEVDTLKHALAHCQSMSVEEYKAFMLEMAKEMAANNPDTKSGKKRLKVENDKLKAILIKNNLTW